MKNQEQHVYQIIRVLTGHFLDGHSIEKENRVSVGHGLEIVFSYIEKNRFTSKMLMRAMENEFESFSMKIIIYPHPLCFARAVTFEQYGIIKQDAMSDSRIDIQTFYEINNTLLQFLEGCNVNVTGVVA